MKQKFDGKVLDYPAIANDVHFIVTQVGDEVDGSLLRAQGISLGDVAVVCHTAMQGTVLFQALVQSILRLDKEHQPDQARNAAGKRLLPSFFFMADIRFF